MNEFHVTFAFAFVNKKIVATTATAIKRIVATTAIVVIMRIVATAIKRIVANYQV